MEKIIEIRSTLKKLIDAELKLIETVEKFKPIQEGVLKKHELKDDEGNLILQIERMYLSDDEDKCREIYNELHEEYLANGANIPHEVGYSPILIAESECRKLERCFAEKSFDFVKENTDIFNGIQFHQLLTNIDLYDKFVKTQRSLYENNKG